MKPHFFRTDNGDRLVLMSRDDYDSMRRRTDPDWHENEEMHRSFELEEIHPLRFWREKAGLTQEQLATKAGYKQSYISDIERLRKKPTREAHDALQRALGKTFPLIDID